MGDGGAGRTVSGGSWLSWSWELKLSGCMMGGVARSRRSAGWRNEGSSGLCVKEREDVSERRVD